MATLLILSRKLRTNVSTSHELPLDIKETIVLFGSFWSINDDLFIEWIGEDLYLFHSAHSRAGAVASKGSAQIELGDKAPDLLIRMDVHISKTPRPVVSASNDLEMLNVDTIVPIGPGIEFDRASVRGIGVGKSDRLLNRAVVELRPQLMYIIRRNVILDSPKAHPVVIGNGVGRAEDGQDARRMNCIGCIERSAWFGPRPQQQRCAHLAGRPIHR